MIVVNAVVHTNQAAVEALKESIATMERKSRAEAGCLDYTFSVELNRPDVLRITEKWDSAESLAAHFRQPHMEDFRAAISAHPVTVDVSFYEATEIERPTA